MLASLCVMSQPSADELKSQVRSSPAQSLKEAYAGRTDDDIPIGGYATMMAAFVGSVTALLLAAQHSRGIPKRIVERDVLLIGVATHRLTRIVARDKIAIPLRAPFTRYERSEGAGMVKEQPRGPGLRRAIGNLLVCQFCVGPSVASGLMAGLLFAPRVTRFVSSVFAAVSVSDFLHQAYAGARRWSR